MTTQTPEERLRAELKQEFVDWYRVSSNVGSEPVSNWWLDKMNQEINAAVERGRNDALQEIHTKLVSWEANIALNNENLEEDETFLAIDDVAKYVSSLLTPSQTHK